MYETTAVVFCIFFVMAGIVGAVAVASYYNLEETKLIVEGGCDVINTISETTGKKNADVICPGVTP